MLSYLTDWLEKGFIGFSRAASYLLYLVPLRLWQFKHQHPQTNILVSGVTKARKVAANSPVQYDLKWIRARRGMLVLTATDLVCGNWTIPLETIREAILLDLTGGYVLKVFTSTGEQYQFGLNKNADWKTQSVLPLTHQKGSIEYSTQSLILRGIALMGLIGYLYQGLSTANLAKILLALMGTAWIGIPLILRIAQKVQPKG
ncbi:hypothetical protein [Acaryochloris sp. IP29b_bin.148]|uniref:hypothetical protein n=1 Tax=Acaryochloris sp. IP29b_bin.148 TaxID=2969218 RepID=UPI002607D3DF|nr:hypothetical protein [Acaryochloris sp. IP29b_bin.148]